jgi:uncharacterized protein
MSQATSNAKPSRLFRRFHVIAKPAGSRCNLDCTYCYYLHKGQLLPETAKGRISDELLEEFIRQYIEGQDADTIAFSWHGGEPTLLGVGFFRKVVELQEKYAGDKKIENDLQTNGSLIDDEWCEFFKEHNFLVGLSLDGPKEFHDHFRIAGGEESSFDHGCRAVRLLRRHDVVFNTLTVVNSITAQHPDEVYRFLTEDLGVKRLQWLPCVELKEYCTRGPGPWNADAMPIVGTPAARPGNPDSVVTEWTVDPDDWGEFLCRTFDLWRKHGYGTVLVNWFESLVGQWMHAPAQLCTLAEVCGRGLAMEKDGELYPCDHFVYPEYRLGNLRDKDRQLADVVYSSQQRKFGCRKRDQLSDYCRECSYRFACNGDCPKNRFTKTPDGEPGLSYLCPGLKRFLTHADPGLREIVAELERTGTPDRLGTSVETVFPC